MHIEVVEEGPGELTSYGSVPIAFEVVETFEPGRAQGDYLASRTLRRVQTPVVKDYDASEGHAPADWPSRFDLTGWRFLAARVNGQRVGGAAVIVHAGGTDILEGRHDLGLLWDIRVAPTIRRTGVGSALLRAVEERSRADGLRELKVETQNINVPACRFYARHGFKLRHVVHDAYPEHPTEVQLLWYKILDGSTVQER